MEFKIENLSLEEIMYIESCLLERLEFVEKNIYFSNFDSEEEEKNLINEKKFNSDILKKIKY